ncbi:50S ribosomal protein L11 methyltransferase [Croceicoccus naphthovorans]|uniref:Ribosomal protein L11 methyltransferase n=1 Tax=Croceicoccus naphthovorans TaxID=1348774 RepID=A0A0G3XIN3_9SPHN|nr:50S ribosomal protein L11 methyltransferase [Croceicoccus naphthovorans]AKM10481.1 ribonucleotide-diphosphate reductase subunit beta [Croceicoccus naphthovorans]MBB3988655.1 ribosomal protein L11 methyltransferase [Croceicoccus naphthovorans]
MSWKIVAHGSKEVIQSALVAHEDALDWDYEVVLTGSEIAEDKPDDWVLEAYYPRRPTKADKTALAALFEGLPPAMRAEKLPDEDWVSLSQANVTPIRAGRFHVHTPDFPAYDSAGVTDFCIPTSQAFGTGQHETTAGCLAMLTQMKAEGVAVRNYADIGTGTGLLAFAARDLWPTAHGLASDIDPVCTGVVEDNSAANGVPLGDGPGRLVMTVAAGTDNPLIAARAPYDLLIANIFAGPLVDLAPDFARAVLPGGHLVLAGLLTTQEPAVRAAHFRAGFRLARRMTNGDWSILWLRRRNAR